MSRTNYTPPALIQRHRTNLMSLRTASGTESDHLDQYEELIERYNDLLQMLFRWTDDQEQILEANGPFYETELGQPLASMTEIYRKGASNERMRVW